jgi:hypothetical protein
MSRSRPQLYVCDAYHHPYTYHGDFCPDNALSDPAINLSSELSFLVELYMAAQGNHIDYRYHYKQ